MDDHPNTMKCPICLDFISAAYATSCGHSFCHACIIRHLRVHGTCPSCSVELAETDLRPNRSLERLVKKLKRSCPSSDEEYYVDGGGGEVYQSFLTSLLASKQRHLETLQASIACIKDELNSHNSDMVPGSRLEIPKSREMELSALYDRFIEEGKNFKKLFTQLTFKHSLRPLSSITFGDVLSPSNVVSSVEYNPRNQLFAVSGSVKQIRIYNYQTFSRPYPSFLNTRFSVPVVQLMTSCKVAALTWGPSAVNTIAAADYEGSVKIYDIETEAPIYSLDEHERRVWSIDYSKASPNGLLSGSDDGRVKHWDVSREESTFTIDVKANVCSVQFHPDGHTFAIGAADHNLYLHDLRSPVRPFGTLRGHKKAVSYVKWMEGGAVLSASTDNTIKQWKDAVCIKTHSGHVHEKNFVGLAVNGDLFACGSENNKLYLYSRYLENPISEISLGGRDPLSGEFLEMEGFGSSVSWINDRELLVGNSLGLVSALCIINSD